MRRPLFRSLLLLAVVSGIVLASVAGPVQGQTEPEFVETDITRDTTWTPDEGPYRIVANVTVAPDTTLTIEPGTTVQVAEGISLSVDGSLVAEGTDGSPITFTSPRVAPTRGTWGSIRATGEDQVAISLSHLRLQYATTGVTIANPATELSVEDSIVTALAADGISLANATGSTEVTVRNTRFRGLGGNAVAAGTEGARVSRVSGWSIVDSTFESLGADAVAITSSTVREVTLTGNEFAENEGPAVSIGATDLGSTTLRDNTVRDSHGGFDLDTASAGVIRVLDNRITASGNGIGFHATRNVNQLVVTDNRVVDGETGVEISHDPAGDSYYSFATTIARNDLSNNAVHGLFIDSLIFAGPAFAIHNNTLVDNGWYGARLAVAELRNADIADNQLAGNGEGGLSVVGRHVRATTVRDNLAWANEGPGLSFDAEREITDLQIRNNSALNNAGTGLLIAEGDAAPGNVSVRDNLVAANAYGLHIVGPQTTRIAHNEIVFNTYGFGTPVVTSGLQDGIGVIVADGQDNVFLEDNDIYGHRVGLFVDTRGTVRADGNFWGSETGAYHRSINPEGEGDVVVTQRGWVDIIYATSERIGRAHSRPTPRLEIAPQPATAGQEITVSGVNSGDPDGTVERYRFTIDGSTTLGADAERTIRFDEPGAYQISLAVEDDLGIESREPATTTLQVEPAATTTTPTTTGPTTTTDGGTTTPGTTPPGTDDDEERGPLGALLSIGGILGAIFYLVAIGLGARGMYQTVAEQPLTVNGRRVQLLAGLGIVIWGLASVVSHGALLQVSLAGLVLWAALTGAAFVIARYT